MSFNFVIFLVLFEKQKFMGLIFIFGIFNEYDEVDEEE
jgi:hypothetical protein